MSRELLDPTLILHVQHIAARLCEGSDEADDYAQDALARILERSDEYRGEGTFRAFASIVAANHIRNLLRANRIRERFLRNHHYEILMCLYSDGRSYD